LTKTTITKGTRDSKVLPKTTTSSSSSSLPSSSPPSLKFKLPPAIHPFPSFKEQEEGGGREGGREEEEDLRSLLSCCLQSWEEQWKVAQKKLEGGMEALREEGGEGGREGVVGRLERVEGMMREEVLPLVKAMEQSMAAMRARVG